MCYLWTSVYMLHAQWTYGTKLYNLNNHKYTKINTLFYTYDLLFKIYVGSSFIYFRYDDALLCNDLKYKNKCTLTQGSLVAHERNSHIPTHKSGKI